MLVGCKIIILEGLVGCCGGYGILILFMLIMVYIYFLIDILFKYV